jgi:two-component system sensor histidine kinase/response regulator
LASGSTFWVTLPLERGAPARVCSHLPEPARAQRVLVVDDNHTAATVLSDMLLAHGLWRWSRRIRACRRWKCCATVDGNSSACLACCCWTGTCRAWMAWSWQRHIRSLGMPRNVPQMLMVTAYGREDVMRAARSQGIETVLIKPVNALRCCWTP